MGQITTATIAMIRRAVDANQAPPLTLWEFRQLAFLAEKQLSPAVQWQKRCPNVDDNAWSNCSEGDAKFWAHRGWDVRALHESAPLIERPPLTPAQRRELIDRAGDITDGLNQDDFADEIIKLVEEHHGIRATKQAEAPTASNEREALHTVLDRFEAKERGIPQAHIAAQLVTELRAALATQQEAQPQAEPAEWPTVPDRVMELVQVYGDARADDKYSALRLSELIYALRQWAGTLKAAQAEPAGGDKEDAERIKQGNKDAD